MLNLRDRVRQVVEPIGTVGQSVEVASGGELGCGIDREAGGWILEVDWLAGYGVRV